MNTAAQTNYRPTGSRRVIAQRNTAGKYTYTLVCENGKVEATYRVWRIEETGCWAMQASDEIEPYVTYTKAMCVGHFTNWIKGGAHR